MWGGRIKKEKFARRLEVKIGKACARRSPGASATLCTLACRLHLCSLHMAHGPSVWISVLCLVYILAPTLHIDGLILHSYFSEYAECRCRMQNAEPSPKCLVSVCAACRMQDAQDAETRIGPKIDSSAWRAGCAGCRMQERCKIRPKELVRRVQLTAPASASCILHRVQGICGFGPDSAFCILHPASRCIAIG